MPVLALGGQSRPPAPSGAQDASGAQAASARTAGGQVYVDGAGDVRISGNFLAFGDVAGMRVRIIDRAGDGRVIAGGRVLLRPRSKARRSGSGGTRVTRPRRLTFTPSARQRFSIEGRKLVVSFRGEGNVTLSITGTGKVRLDGVGTYRTNSQPAEAWSLAPMVLPLRPTRRGGQG